MGSGARRDEVEFVENNLVPVRDRKPQQLKSSGSSTLLCCSRSQRGHVGRSLRGLIFFCWLTLPYRQGVSLSRWMGTASWVPSCPLARTRRTSHVKCSERAPESVQNATGARISRAASATERRVRSSEAIPGTPPATPRVFRCDVPTMGSLCTAPSREFAIPLRLPPVRICTASCGTVQPASVHKHSHDVPFRLSIRYERA